MCELDPQNLIAYKMNPGRACPFNWSGGRCTQLRLSPEGCPVVETPTYFYPYTTRKEPISGSCIYAQVVEKVRY
jgi:hypothetical protein